MWIAGAISVCCFASLPALQSPEQAAMRTVMHGGLTSPATRGRLDVILAQQGRIDSANNARAINECEWTTQILELAPEGTWVQEGDIIAVLDSAEVVEKLRDREVLLIEAEADLVQAQETLKMQELENASGRAKAELAHAGRTRPHQVRRR